MPPAPCEQNESQTGVKNITLPQILFAGGKVGRQGSSNFTFFPPQFWIRYEV